MEELRRALAFLCGMAVLKTVLEMLLPQGGMKRFAQFGFAFVQMMLTANVLVQMMQSVIGVFT